MLSKLTEQAAERFAAMRDKVEDTQRQMLGVQRRIGDVEQQLRNTNPDTQVEEFAALQRELDRQRGRLREAQHSFLELSRLHTAIRTWIAQLAPAIQLEDVEIGLADLANGELPNDAVVRVRCEIKDLANERSAIRSALPPVEEVCAEADAQIDALAARGRPSVPHDGKTGGDQAATLLVWLFSDQIKERLRKELKAQRTKDAGMLVLSAAEREHRLASAGKLILDKEREEEWLIRRAEQQGTTIPRRDKASPLAILGLCIGPRGRATERQAAAA